MVDEGKPLKVLSCFHLPCLISEASTENIKRKKRWLIKNAKKSKTVDFFVGFRLVYTYVMLPFKRILCQQNTLS